MANVKSVAIKGVMPFNILDDASESLTKFFACFSLPTWGLKIVYGKQDYRDNEHGGQTAFFEFHITGQEAFNYELFYHRLAEMRKLGALISTAIVKDMENNGAWDAIPDINRAYKELEVEDEGDGMQGEKP